MDIYSIQKRSEIMSRVRNRDTKPELAVRSFLHRQGLRFRVQCRGLPGVPDLTFGSRRIALFVHGCFWHGHVGCRNASMPTTRRQFWENKILANRERDARNRAALEKLGWVVLEIWECEINPASLQNLHDQIVKTNRRARSRHVAV